MDFSPRDKTLLAGGSSTPAGVQLIDTRKISVLVVGAGVSGLTTALCLRCRGFKTTVVAEKFAPEVTSVVAGALWEWPPAVCGYHHDQLSLARSKEWCMTSYNIFADLAKNQETGVFLRPVVFYFRRKVEESAQNLAKMDELKNKVRQFRHDPAMIEEHNVNPRIGLKDAYSHLAPMVDTDVYMAWLLKSLRATGCRIIRRRINCRIRDQEQQLKREFGADLIVNCAGLGARDLAAEYMYPLRGALVRVLNDGITMPRIRKAHCISHDETRNDQDIIFIVPRGHNMLVLGGLAEPDEWGLDIGLDNYQPVRDMYARCLEFLPILKQARIDPNEPVRAGLRPFRKQNVRLDHEQDTGIIHNYGHGGAGVTFSWGCALEVVELAERLFACSRERVNLGNLTHSKAGYRPFSAEV
jgi:D-amino-acid oxidase